MATLVGSTAQEAWQLYQARNARARQAKPAHAVYARWGPVEVPQRAVGALPLTLMASRLKRFPCPECRAWRGRPCTDRPHGRVLRVLDWHTPRYRAFLGKEPT